MSQAGIINVAGGGGGGAPVQTLTGDTGGPVPPTANNINILGSSGITVAGNAGTSTLTISIQNSFTYQTQTIGATTADFTPIPLPAAGTYTFEVRIAAWKIAGGIAPNAGAGLAINGVMRSDGVTATLIGDSDGFSHTDPELDGIDVNIIAVGNTAVVRVLGVAGLTINWGAFIVYVFRGA